MNRRQIVVELVAVGFELVEEKDQYDRLRWEGLKGSAYARPRARTGDDLAATGTVKGWLAERAKPSSITDRDWQWRGLQLSRLIARLRE